MDMITQLVERRPNGQESTEAHARLLAANIPASIDARGRALDNVFRERLALGVTSKNISLNQHDLARQLQTDLIAYFDIYNHKRPHPLTCTLSFPFRGPNIGTRHIGSPRAKGRSGNLSSRQLLQKRTRRGMKYDGRHFDRDR